MSLTISSRQVGDVTVITCAGRLVLGDESRALQACLDAALPASAHVLLHLAGIEFIDSGGIGLLARYVTRVQSGAALRLCELSPKVEAVMRLTRLGSAFQIDGAESESIAALHGSAEAARVATGLKILSVDDSSDLLVFLRELLDGAGYHALTASNLHDATILMKAARPRVVVIGARMRDGNFAGHQFHQLASAGPVIDLPAGFSAQDAGDAAQHVLDAIRELLEPTVR